TGATLSIGSLVGFVTLFGIVARNAILLIAHLGHLLAVEGAQWSLPTVLRSTRERLVPILMTALVTALGLLPLALGSGEAGREALYELVLAYRMMQPVQQAGAWLTRVARHRIIDRFRKHKPQPLADRRAAQGEEPDEAFEDLLPAPDGEPESAVIRELLLGEIEAALGELPPEQREVFVAHELDGLSFRELSARSGVR